MVHPSVGLRPPTLLLLYCLLSIFLHAQSLKPTPHRTGDLCTHLARSSFPELGSQHKAYSLSYNHLHLALQVLNTQYAQSIHNSSHLAHLAQITHTYSSYLHRLAFYLYITKGPKTWVNPWADIPYPLHKP
jgi:hypothetical protein